MAVNIADRSIDVKQRTTVYKGFFSVEQVTVVYQKADGELSDPVERLSCERGDAVAVLIWVADSQQLILVRQFRYPTLRHHEAWLLEVVAGSIDAGEEPEAAAVRELREETGIRATRLTKIADFFGSPGGMSEKITLFFVSIDRFDGQTAGGLPGEDLEIIPVSARELWVQLCKGEIHDGKTQVALYWFFAGELGKPFTQA